MKIFERFFSTALVAWFICMFVSVAAMESDAGEWAWRLCYGCLILGVVFLVAIKVWWKRVNTQTVTTYRKKLYREHAERTGRELAVGCPGAHFEGAPNVFSEACALCRLDDNASQETCEKACAACWDMEVET